jgi:hypothetical protein
MIISKNSLRFDHFFDNEENNIAWNHFRKKATITSFFGLVFSRSGFDWVSFVHYKITPIVYKDVADTSNSYL